MGSAHRPDANRSQLGRIPRRPDARQPTWRAQILPTPSRSRNRIRYDGAFSRTTVEGVSEGKPRVSPEHQNIPRKARPRRDGLFPLGLSAAGVGWAEAEMPVIPKAGGRACHTGHLARYGKGCILSRRMEASPRIWHQRCQNPRYGYPSSARGGGGRDGMADSRH